MSLVIHAPNVHQGGGRALLLPLLQVADDMRCTAILDARLNLPSTLPLGLSIVRVPPTVFGRLKAEWRLRQIAKPGDTVLCFGNLPPLLYIPASVKVFLQNRYLLARRDLEGIAWPVRLRIRLERCWLRWFMRRAHLIVQTESMAREAQATLGVNASIMPFFPASPRGEAGQVQRRFDFLYVASGEPHKNHRRLVEAWEILASEGLHPSLCLTLDPARARSLLDWIDAKVQADHLKIENAGLLAQSEVALLYRESRALIYPSLFESFGLPLLEASNAGLPVVAAELDYVRDVVAPLQSFDPASPVSIARAVKRCLGVPDHSPSLLSPADFLRQVEASG